jgi:hypothetical protein
MSTSKFLQKILPRSIYLRLKEMVVFRPEDPQNLIQVLPRFQQNVDVARIKGYRYPAPGSQDAAAAAVPVREHPDQTYDNKLYARDSRNMALDQVTTINATKPVTLEPRGQYGDRTYGQEGKYKNPAVTKYDPTGLRATMNATWGAMDASLAEHAAPNHLVLPEWYKDQAAIEKECERKGIPYVEGRPYHATLTRSRNYNQVRW